MLCHDVLCYVLLHAIHCRSRFWKKHALWFLVSVSISVVLIWRCQLDFSRGWDPVVPTTSLVPPQSYVYGFFNNYDQYFEDNPMPIDFPLSGIDVGDPKNGPLIMQAASPFQFLAHI